MMCVHNESKNAVQHDTIAFDHWLSEHIWFLLIHVYCLMQLIHFFLHFVCVWVYMLKFKFVSFLLKNIILNYLKIWNCRLKKQKHKCHYFQVWHHLHYRLKIQTFKWPISKVHYGYLRLVSVAVVHQHRKIQVIKKVNTSIRVLISLPVKTHYYCSCLNRI